MANYRGTTWQPLPTREMQRRAEQHRALRRRQAAEQVTAERATKKGSGNTPKPSR